MAPPPPSNMVGRALLFNCMLTCTIIPMASCVMHSRLAGFKVSSLEGGHQRERPVNSTIQSALKDTFVSLEVRGVALKDTFVSLEVRGVALKDTFVSLEVRVVALKDTFVSLEVRGVARYFNLC